MFAKTSPPIPEDAVFSFRGVYFTLPELLTVGGCGLIVLAALAILVMYLSRKTHGDFGSVAEDFERNVLSELTAGKTAEAVAIAATSTPVVAPPDVSPSAPVGEGPIPALTQRLRAMGVLGAYKGVQPLGLGPDAQIYAHTGGGTILILPHMESEAFLAHALKQHDMIVAPTSDGQAFIIMPLGDKLSITSAREVRLP